MNKLSTPLIIANLIDRCSIGDRSPGFIPNEADSGTIYRQHESTGAYKESNWLPVQDRSFALAFRIY